MPFGIWKLSFAAVLIVVGLSGCGNGSEMAFWEACTKNVKRGMTLSEVERICGKAQYLGKTGPFQGYKYTPPRRNRIGSSFSRTTSSRKPKFRAAIANSSPPGKRHELSLRYF
jgi:hypothetical protein